MVSKNLRKYQERSLCCKYFVVIFYFMIASVLPVYAQENDVNHKDNVQSEKMLLLEGTLKEIQGDLRGALVDYAKVLEMDPDNVEAYLQIGFVETQQGQIDAGKENIRKGLDLIERALNSDPNNARMYYLRGRAKRYMKDYDGAIEDTKKAINLDPQRVNYTSDLKAIEVERKLDTAVENLP